MSVVLTARATRDLEDGLEAIAEQNPAAAEAIRLHLNQVVALLDSRNMEGIAAKMRSHRDARRFYVHPFWIYYERVQSETRILRVYHHARKPLH